MAPRRSLSSDRWPADLPLALGFEVIRQTEAGVLDAPRPWMEQIIGTASPDQILAELDQYLRGTGAVRLSDWVALEMPANQAGFVDDRTDIVRAAMIGVLMAVNLDRPPSRLTVGDGIAAHRERVRTELQQLARGERGLGERFGIVDAEAKAGAILRAFDAGLEAHDRALRDRIRTAHIDSKRAEALLRDAVLAEWRRGFPRSLLAGAGGRSDPWRPGKAMIVVSQLERKEFFISEQLEESTMEMMGSNWARAILAREAELLIESLGSLHKYSWRLRSLGQRIAQAKRTLEQRGYAPTHLLGPWHWAVWEELLDGPTLHGRRVEGGDIGEVLGMAAFEAPQDFDFVAVLALPRAIHVRQRTFAGDPFDISVSEIGPTELATLQEQGIADVEGAEGDEPVERIQMRAWVTIRESVAFDVRRDAVVCVAVPPALLE